MPMTPHCLMITGCNGQVGYELARLDWGGARVVALTRDDLDLADPRAIRAAIRREKPDVVVNAAAYTAVDRAESEPAVAHRINADAPAVMAEELARLDALLVHYSTDYVFDGRATRPYRESDPTSPAGIYGSSKLAGELAVSASGCEHLVLRTGWVYSYRGANFLRTMLRLAATRDAVNVVADQRGTPTYATDLAMLTRDVVLAAGSRGEAGRGIFHLANAGETTWHGFATEIMRRSGNQHVLVNAIGTVDYPTPARRPAYSVLDKGRAIQAFGVDPPDWRDGLDRCLAEYAVRAAADPASSGDLAGS